MLTMNNKITRTLLIIVLSSIISTCASMNTTQPVNSLVKPVWPAPPAVARISFAMAFSTPQELGLKKSFWQWLGDVVFGDDETRMVRPMDVVTVDNQLIYVADPGVRGVHRFDMRDNSYQLIQGENNLELPSPVALATDGRGNVYFSDSRLAQLFVIRKASEYAQVVELDTAVQQPTGLAVDKVSGDIYLVDTAQHQVLIFNQSGKLKKRFGQRGTDTGEFNYPTLICKNKNTLYITDSLNFRIQSFDLSGKYQSSFGEAGQSSGNQSRPKGVAVDNAGHVYVVDALLNNIQLFNHRGQFLMTVGEQGQKPGQFWLPSGIHISAQQKIYVADSYNRRVQVFSYIGKKS